MEAAESESETNLYNMFTYGIVIDAFPEPSRVLESSGLITNRSKLKVIDPSFNYLNHTNNKKIKNYKYVILYVDYRAKDDDSYVIHEIGDIIRAHNLRV